MSSLAVVNGSNLLGRGLLASLARRHSARLLDPRPYRRSVYALQDELKAHGATLEKQMIYTADSLARGLEGADTVIYINHDYYTLTSDKDDMLRHTARRAKQLGAKRLVALSPIEFDHFLEDPADTETTHTPMERRRLEAEADARAEFPEMTHLRVNLLYGDQSYALRYLTQCMLRGALPQTFQLDHYSTDFHPIHIKDVVAAVEHILENNVAGKNYALLGAEKHSLASILEALEKHVGQKSKSVPILTLTNWFWRWLVGQTHDKNIVDLLSYYQKHDGAFAKAGGESYHEAQGLEYKAPSFSESYGENGAKDEAYELPLLSDYKRIELD